MAIGEVARASRVAPTEERTDWYALSVDDTCRRLEVDPAAGLSASEVVARRQRFGPNKLAEEAKEPVWEAFLRQYRDLMQLVLVGAAVVSIVALQDISTGVVVLGLTVVNALMGLHQEGKAAESVAALRQMLIMTANVRRDGEVVEIPAEELVPGDIVSFEAGDKVPADGRILVAATLEIEEAGLTGESTPVAKGTDPVPGGDVPLGDRVDMAYMNSQVTRGRDEIVIPPALAVRLGVAGLLIAIGTLAVVAWAEDRYGLAIATTMGLATTSLLHIAAALEWRDPFRSVFNRNTIANGSFNILMLVALALTFLVTTVDGLERIFDTVELTGSQWRVCFVAVVSYLALAELGKFILHRIDREATDGRADVNTRTTP